MISKSGLNILLIADVGAESQHSSVEGLFRSRSQLGITCYKVFFDKRARKPEPLEDRVILPYKYRRHGLVRVLTEVCPLFEYDAVIVRNLYHALGQLLRAGLSLKIGFWESFPHSRRRLDEALFEKKSVWRKQVEYAWSHHSERSLIKKCDFYLPITEIHKFIYYPDIQTPYMPTPMGFDFESYPIAPPPKRQGPIRFVYIGAIDGLRQLDIVNRAFMAQQSDFVLDYYSFQENAEVEKIKQIQDPRIRFNGGLSRDKLFASIKYADAGICFFPYTKTHITASPTKTIEYGALGLSVLVNPMPEYKTLLDEQCAFICEFEEDAIAEKVNEILSADRTVLEDKGRLLQQRILKQRSYEDMAVPLFSFIRKQCETESVCVNAYEQPIYNAMAQQG